MGGRSENTTVKKQKGLLHIVLAESAAAIFKIKRIIKQFKRHVHHKSIENF